MIKTIEISIKNGPKESFRALIIYPKNICYINRKKYVLSQEYLDRLIRTIRLWKNEYGNGSIIDGEEFKITVKTEKEEEIFHGKGLFPENYASFKELIGGLYVKSRRTMPK